MTAPPKLVRFLSDAEANYINFGLRLGVPHVEQKRTLQRLCEWYEQKKVLQDATYTRQLIHSLMASEDVLVRRWAIKALALIGNRDDFSRIAARLKAEDDLEAQTWGITGLVKNAEQRTLREICELARVEISAAMSLAARLYAPNSWLANNTDDPRISLDDDELTLKWAIFLIGYEKAPLDLFHPKHSNEVFLGELNAHPAPEISEYSVWALWERQDFGATQSKVPLSEAAKHPENVRKWLYRLGTQSPSDVGLDPDTLSDLRRDRSPKAREGLAQGVVDLPPEAFGNEVLEWYSAEDDQRVRENLLVSMASRNAESRMYSEAVRGQYAKEPPDSPVRRRLLAASVNSPLYQGLRGIDVKTENDRQGLLEYGATGNNTYIQHTGDIFLFQNTGDVVVGSNFNAGRDINAQAIAGGDMIDSANAAVQHLERSDEATAKVLKEVLAFLEGSKDVPGNAEAAEAVKAVAADPSEANKKSLLERLKGYVSNAAAAGTILMAGDKVIHAVQGLLP